MAKKRKNQNNSQSKSSEAFFVLFMKAVLKIEYILKSHFWGQGVMGNIIQCTCIYSLKRIQVETILTHVLIKIIFMIFGL